MSRRILRRFEQQKLSNLEDIAEQLWQCCRVRLRSNLGGIVQRSEPDTAWDTLVLDEATLTALHCVISATRNRHKVHHEWRMGRSNERGIGINALLYGPPGTGKTTATEIIAHKLGIDLYRVSLYWLSGEHIGEVERQLEKIFKEAEAAGALLVLDEVDSFMDRRADVKERRDRYANQPLSYLLQRMEAHTGLTVLITNQPDLIDPVFMERIAFKVRFEFPTLEQRIEIWKRTFPKEAPTEGLSFQRLAQLDVSGAMIRNIALGGAYLALDETGEVGDEVSIRMKHLLKAAHMECSREDKLIVGDEIRGWV
jgi:SpoVK/Ycf46/Vps4 family AAA+-type ATPase